MSFIPKVNAIKELPLYPLAERLSPTCYQCKHFLKNETCKAYPKGIPPKLFLGPYWHIMLLPDQEGEFLFEPKTKK